VWFPGVWILCSDISEYLICFIFICVMLMLILLLDETEFSETSAHKIQTPGILPPPKKRIRATSDRGQFHIEIYCIFLSLLRPRVIFILCIRNISQNYEYIILCTSFRKLFIILSYGDRLPLKWNALFQNKNKSNFLPAPKQEEWEL
jgi:hypothetical protein